MKSCNDSGRAEGTLIVDKAGSLPLTQADTDLSLQQEVDQTCLVTHLTHHSQELSALHE